MKALMIKEPFVTEMNEIEKPVRKEGEALLKIKYCGICGADVSSYTGNQPFTTYPRIPGHEFSAEIVEIPENDKGLKAGDIVTANPYFNCGHCYPCQRGFVNCCTDNQTMGVQRDGSFCEYVSMPIERIYDGKGLSAKQLALIEPFTISYHAIKRAKVGKGDKVLVLGAGPIGIFAVIAAKLKGAEVYSADLLDGRLSLAKAYGADGVINVGERDTVEAAMEITGGNGFDVCVEAAGSPITFLNCINSVAFAGRIALIGNCKKETTFNHSILLKKELNVFGSRNSYAEDFKELIDIVVEGKVDVMKMVSGVYALEDTGKALEALSKNDGSLAKILIEVNGQ